MTQNPHGEVKLLRGNYSTKSGTTVVFELAERDFLDELIAIGPGTRFMMVLAPINDEEELDHDKLAKAEIAKDRVKRAALLCDDKAFWPWISEVAKRPVRDKETAAQALRAALGINSRADIGKIPKVGQQFDRLREDFERHTGRIQ